MRPHPERALAQSLLFDRLQHRETRRTGHRRTGIGAAETTRRRRIHDRGLAHDRGERKSARETLGERHQVGLDARVLDRKHPPGAREAGLDLVDHENDAVLIAEPAERLQELRRRDVEPALAHHRLDDDRRDPRGLDVVFEELLDRGQAVGDADPVIRDRERRVIDLGRERPERRLVRRNLAGERHRHERAAVEAAAEGDHTRATRCGRARS